MGNYKNKLLKRKTKLCNFQEMKKIKANICVCGKALEGQAQKYIKISLYLQWFYIPIKTLS